MPMDSKRQGAIRIAVSSASGGRLRSDMVEIPSGTFRMGHVGFRCVVRDGA
jgi:hypothetical protein